jgi:hypothetical protein
MRVVPTLLRSDVVSMSFSAQADGSIAGTVTFGVQASPPPHEVGPS